MPGESYKKHLSGCHSLSKKTTRIPPSLRFYLLILPFSLFSLIGFISAHILYGWGLVGLSYIGWVLLYFMVLEMPIHCRYCPAYALSGSQLKCQAKWGFWKLGHTCNQVQKKYERILFLFGLLIILVFPIVFNGYAFIHSLNHPVSAALFLILGIFIVGSTVFLLRIQRRTFCIECTHPTCPLKKGT
jgi:hypothetical protein